MNYISGVHALYTDFNKAFDMVDHNSVEYKVSSLFNIAKYLNSEYLLYADDMKILRAIRSDVKKIPPTPKGINRLHDWCTRNRRRLNIKKCAIMAVSSNRKLRS